MQRRSEPGHPGPDSVQRRGEVLVRGIFLCGRRQIQGRDQELGSENQLGCEDKRECYCNQKEINNNRYKVCYCIEKFTLQLKTTFSELSSDHLTLKLSCVPIPLYVKLSLYKNLFDTFFLLQICHE